MSLFGYAKDLADKLIPSCKNKRMLSELNLIEHLVPNKFKDKFNAKQLGHMNICNCHQLMLSHLLILTAINKLRISPYHYYADISVHHCRETTFSHYK